MRRGPSASSASSDGPPMIPVHHAPQPRRAARRARASSSRTPKITRRTTSSVIACSRGASLSGAVARPARDVLARDRGARRPRSRPSARRGTAAASACAGACAAGRRAGAPTSCRGTGSRTRFALPACSAVGVAGEDLARPRRDGRARPTAAPSPMRIVKTSPNSRWALKRNGPGARDPGGGLRGARTCSGRAGACGSILTRCQHAVNRARVALGSAAMTRVACHQLAPVLGDLAGNRARALAAIDAAAAAGADVVVLPELVTSGYVFERRRRGAAAGRARRRADARAAGRSARAAHGLVDRGRVRRGAATDGTLYNSAALVDASGVRAVYRKAHLWDREPECFRPGDEPPAGRRHAARPDRADGLLRPRVPRVGARGRARGRRAAVRADELAARAAPGRRAPDGGPHGDGPRGDEPDGDRGLRPLRHRARRGLGERHGDRGARRLAAGRPARGRSRRCCSPTSTSPPRATRRSGRATTRSADRRPALYPGSLAARRCRGDPTDLRPVLAHPARADRPPARACSAGSRPRSARPAGRSATSSWSRPAATHVLRDITVDAGDEAHERGIVDAVRARRRRRGRRLDRPHARHARRRQARGAPQAPAAHGGRPQHGLHAGRRARLLGDRRRPRQARSSTRSSATRSPSSATAPPCSASATSGPRPRCR